MMSPRIYIYKITFEEVLYYYYGVHKEKKFNEYYMGSPVTHKWMWNFYTPKKQILEVFEYSDEGWEEASEVEQRLIRPVYNDDKWCLNETCGQIVSLEVMRKTGKDAYEQGLGIHSLTKEQRSENSKKIGKRAYEQGLGIHGMSTEERVENGKRNGRKCHELGIGIFALSKEELSENGKRGGQKAGEANYENKVGVHARTKEEMTEHGKMGGKKCYELGLGFYSLTSEQRSENSKKGGVKTAKKHKELGLGFYSLTSEQRSENGKRGGAIIAEKRSKEFVLISPEGKIVRGKNITKFCRENNLQDSNIHKVLNGSYKQHKGWRKYIPDKITILDFL